MNVGELGNLHIRGVLQYHASLFMHKIAKGATNQFLRTTSRSYGSQRENAISIHRSVMSRKCVIDAGINLIHARIALLILHDIDTTVHTERIHPHPHCRHSNAIFIAEMS